VAIRNKILQAFEQAEAERSEPSPDLLTFVLVGAGPTGVEMASAIALLVRSTLKSEFRRIDPAVCTNCPRAIWRRECLGPFPRIFRGRQKKKLEEIGRRVRLGHSVDQIDADGIMVAGERILSKTVIWTAGVAPSPAGQMLSVETEALGVYASSKISQFPGHPEILWWRYRIARSKRQAPARCCAGGDPARALRGKLITVHVIGGHMPGPFSYFGQRELGRGGQGFCCAAKRQVPCERDRGMARVGAVQLQFLATSSLRLSVFLQWFGRI